jgi:copper chaperone CopZ
MKITYHIPDMHCSNCVMHLEALEDELPGITSVDASYHKQLMVVDFNPEIIDEDRLIEAIVEKGYTVEKSD